MPEATAPAAETAPVKGKRSARLSIVAAVLVVLAGGSGAGWFFFSQRGVKPPAAHTEEVKPPLHVLKAGTVVVNIAGTEGKRYLRTTVEVGATEKDAKHLEELRAPLRDLTIEVRSTKPLEQLLGPERDPLREELKKRFNAVLGHPAVTHVYTEFLVQ
jgi:flagellar basal body-associated protein FliL